MASTSSTSSIPLQNNSHKTTFLTKTKTKLLQTRIKFPFSSTSTKTKTINSSNTTRYNETVIVDEEMDKIRRLQNGSDVRGIALVGEKGRTVDLTPPAVEAIAESFGEWVKNGMEKEKGNSSIENVRVSLGKDPRISGTTLSVAVFSGLVRAGCLVFDMKLATTPACFMSTILPPFAYDASIMMTASHLPYTRNGLKFFTKKGGLTSTDVEEICDKAAHKYANRLARVSTMLNVTITRVDFMNTYAKHLREIIKERVNHPSHYDTPLKGFQEHPETTIVTDARTSLALTRFITNRGGQHCLYRVGYRNVIDKSVRLNEDGIDTHLMMETSGHGALKENYFLDDGAYMVVKIIIEMVRMKLEGSGEGIGSLIQDLEEPLESIELRMNIVSEPRNAKAKAIEVIEAFRNYIEDGKIEGWELDACGDCWVSEGCLVDLNDSPAAIDAHMYRAKVSDKQNGQHGWVHIRQSIHNPNIALNMQSSIPGSCRTMTKALREKFLIASRLDEILDISKIEEYAKSGHQS